MCLFFINNLLHCCNLSCLLDIMHERSHRWVELKVPCCGCRGCAKVGEDGKLEITLPGYAFVEDGLLLYEALDKFVDDYLHLYYSDEEGKRVRSQV